MANPEPFSMIRVGFVIIQTLQKLTFDKFKVWLICLCSGVLGIMVFNGKEYFINIMNHKKYENNQKTTLSSRAGAEVLLNRAVENIMEYTGGKGEFALVVFNWEDHSNGGLYKLDSKYLYIATSDRVNEHNKGKYIDGRFQMKNYKDPNKHDDKSSKHNIVVNWNNGPAMYELTKDYEAIAGGAVANMFENYWFIPFSRAGITHVPNDKEPFASRFVLMLDKEAAEALSESRAIKLITNFKEDYVRLMNTY